VTRNYKRGFRIRAKRKEEEWQWANRGAGASERENPREEDGTVGKRKGENGEQFRRFASRTIRKVGGGRRVVV